MSIPEDKIGKLYAFGYTEVEARFLYLVATHSGYFTLRQFLDFAHAKSGKRNSRSVEKLFSWGHASARYTRAEASCFNSVRDRCMPQSASSIFAIAGSMNSFI